MSNPLVCDRSASRTATGTSPPVTPAVPRRRAAATVARCPTRSLLTRCLARIYDAFDGNRDDLDLYVDLIRGLDAQHVLDVGCGTGSLSILLAHCGVKVTAVDPAAASLEVARPKRVQIG